MQKQRSTHGDQQEGTSLSGARVPRLTSDMFTMIVVLCDSGGSIHIKEAPKRQTLASTAGAKRACRSLSARLIPPTALFSDLIWNPRLS